MERVAILFSLIVLASARSSGDEKRAAKPKKSTDEITKDRIIIVRPELFSVIVTPRAVSLEGNIKWQDAQMCKGGSFASGFLQWQDDSGWDQKGLTKLQFVCTVPKLAGLNHTLPSALGADRQQISVGIQYGKQTGGTEFCPNEGMFFVGMKVVFGGWHLGVIEVRPICESINWWSTSGGGSGAPKPPARELSRSLAAFGWNKVGLSKGWEKSEPYYCPVRMAICGINSSNDQSMGFFEDGSGINLIEFFCCPFPILMNGEKMESA